MLKKIATYYHTLKYLRPVQFQYRAYYFFRQKYRKFSKFHYNLSEKSKKNGNFKLEISIPQHKTWIEGNNFNFLNQKKDFNSKIDWNYSEFGKLWVYNLCYFEYLEQNDLSKDEGLRLIRDFIANLPIAKDALEPFPTALRIMYWVKFLTKHAIDDAVINDSLLAQVAILTDNLEYHILGNHLLEDGFGLLFAAYYFKDEKLYKIAQKIVISELNEEVLPDGGHFELSTMYHQHILFRVLDGINLGKNNAFQQQKLLPFLTQKAEIMLGWLHKMTFRNGDIPMVNDAAPHIAPSSQDLFDYAKRLNIPTKSVTLCESGYRKYATDRLELIADIGNVGADYILGHAHSDTFNFVLYIDNQPVIIDKGISTYESNATRQTERSTASHNTICVNGLEQTEVWGGFRVAKRAKVTILQDSETGCKAAHDGYQKIGVTHERAFDCSKNEYFLIKDNVFTTKNKKSIDNWESFLHFHPNSTVLSIENEDIETNTACIDTTNAKLKIHTANRKKLQINVVEYDFCTGFNQTKKAEKLIINGVNDVVFIEIYPK